MLYGISLWSLWVNCPGYVPPKILHTPSLHVMGGWWGNVGESLDAVQALLSSSQNTGVLSICF